MAVYGAEAVHVQGDANNNVAGDQVNNVYNLSLSDTEIMLHSLAEKAAANACYDSEQRFPPPNCHPGTRTEILGILCKWIDHSSKGPRVCWLYGSAGVGKSAIAQNITEKYAISRLAAAFFFSWNNSSRDNLTPFVASIAYQFCKPGSSLKPVLCPMIIDALRSDPNVFHASCEIQFQKLIVEPCSKIEPAVWEKLPNLVVVDGLDECVHILSQERILAILREAVATPLPLPLLFLICSCLELQIRDGFGHEDFDFDMALGSLVIESTEEADRDIESYLLNRFGALRMKHRAS
ncbi:nwd2 [Moniliophthora roreri]|nr:nwd2 [Moniliophthora roreri]